MCRGADAARDLHAVLSLRPDAKLSEVRKAYRRAALRAHPDKGGSAQEFHAVKFAFEVLCSSSRDVSDVQGRRGAATSMQAQKVSDASRRPGSKMKMKWPQPRTCVEADQSPPRKRRHCAAFPKCSPKAATKGIAATSLEEALERMRVVLQFMAAPQRLASIHTVEPCIAASLHAYMKRWRAAQPIASCVKWSTTYNHSLRRPHHCGAGRVHVGKNGGDKRYRTQLVIKGLRMYTLAKRYEVAIEQHIILVQMRDALAFENRRDPSLWTKPQKLYGLLVAVLDKHGTSEQDIHLHTFVYMRAAPWLHATTVVSSPTMQLSEAILVYTQLLRAQRVSWERFRAEWVRVLLLQRKGEAQVRSQAQAEVVADNARRVALEKQFTRVKQCVKSAINREKAKAAALRRDAIRRQRQYFKQRRLRYKDLTMEDFMNGSRA